MRCERWFLIHQVSATDFSRLINFGSNQLEAEQLILFSLSSRLNERCAEELKDFYFSYD